jgi:hypothetical protein
MIGWVWRRIRFSAPGQIICETSARAKRLFDESPVGHAFYKLPKIVRVTIYLLPLIAILVPTGFWVYQQFIHPPEVRQVIITRRPGQEVIWMEGTTLRALDSVEIQFPGSVAKDPAAFSKLIQPLDQNYTLEFHKDPRDQDRVDKILLKLKGGARLHVANNIAGTIAPDGGPPKRFEIVALGD